MLALGALLARGTDWRLLMALDTCKMPLGGDCFLFGDTGAGSGVMDVKKSASCWEDGISDSVEVFANEPVLDFLLEFRLTVLVEVVLEEDGLTSKLAPKTNGSGAGAGDKDCVLLKLTFSEFSVNWIDCLL